MGESFSILLTGLKSAEEGFAISHFAQSGHAVVTARDIAEGKGKLKSHAMGLVYLQASSDDKAVEEIKEAAIQFASLPIVLICEQPMESLVHDGLQAGASDVLFPPLSHHALAISLQRAVGQLRIHGIDARPPAPARFLHHDEAGKECWASILPPRFTIGRSSGSNLILNHISISRTHAEVLVQNGEYLLRDVGSKQGTYLNGTRIETAKLTNGDRIQLGGPQGIGLVFHEGDLLQSLLGVSDASYGTNLSVRGFREVGMLLSTFRALSSIPLLDDLLSLVVDTAIELTGAERGFIMLKEGCCL